MDYGGAAVISSQPRITNRIQHNRPNWHIHVHTFLCVMEKVFDLYNRIMNKSEQRKCTLLMRMRMRKLLPRVRVYID